VLKLLMHKCTATGREVAEQICLPFRVVDELLSQMKSDQWIVHKGAAQLGDYVYQLTDAGMDLARRISKHCSYFGAAPVPLAEYIASVHEQSITHQRPTCDELATVFSDLVINDEMQQRIGEAIHCGRGFFLYGAPGNGKSSVAERVARAFGQTIWIPRAIGVDGEIVRLYDPCNHVLAPGEVRDGIVDSQQIDRRWVRIRRPTIIVGGELTMDRLEISPCAGMGISEAPLQLKSNCGVLVIDDFGRQRMRVEELLNRWIVPLDKQHDYLNLTSGKAIQVPFDQLLVFSTNLEPKDLVDEAFLRRIPYKIEIAGPSEDDFRSLFRVEAERLGVLHSDEAVDHLISVHYTAANRAFRYCHPRDLILQVRHACTFRRRTAAMSIETLDQAVRNYFAVVS
jgi:predicted ATPase with chaperone activity